MPRPPMSGDHLIDLDQVKMRGRRWHPDDTVAVECVLVALSCGVPLRGLGFGLAASGPAWAGSYGCSAGAG